MLSAFGEQVEQWTAQNAFGFCATAERERLLGDAGQHLEDVGLARHVGRRFRGCFGRCGDSDEREPASHAPAPAHRLDGVGATTPESWVDGALKAEAHFAASESDAISLCEHLGFLDANAVDEHAVRAPQILD